MTPASIVHMFFEACLTFDKKNAVLVKQDSSYKPISHKFFRQRVTQFGRGLLALGINQNDKLGILSETRFEWAIADLGILCAGGIDVPIYPSLSPSQISFILQNSEACGVVVACEDQVAKVLSIKEDLPNLRLIICMDTLKNAPEGVLTMKEVEALGAQTDNESALESRWQHKTHDDLLTIIYTSGTTGVPKGVMLSHGNFLSNIKSCESFMPYGPDDSHVSHLPLSHVLERMGGYYCMIFRGVTIAYAESLLTVAENIREVRPTILISVPRFFEKMYAQIMARVLAGGFLKRQLFSWATGLGRQALPYFCTGQTLPGLLGHKWNLANKLVFSKVKEATGGQLKYLISGGAPLSKEIAEFFIGMDLRIAEGYGLTETSPVLTINRPDWIKPGTVGLAVDGVEIKIADDGEILARGPNIMKGYFNNPEATAGCLIEGWFHTDDIGVLDQDGFLRITDRKKDMLVTSSGKNIAPQPLESALKLSPLIEHAVVLGDNNNFVAALLAPPWETVAEWAPKHAWPTDPETLCTHPAFIATIQREVDHHMNGFAHYEKVKAFRILPRLLSIDAGELTPTMKVKRGGVAKSFQVLIDEIYGLSGPLQV